MKHFFKLVIVAVVIVFLHILSKKENQGLQELVFENIEALAYDEGSITGCMGSGSVDCFGQKVEVMYRNGK